MTPKERSREWYKDNRELCLAREKSRREKNRDKMKAYQKEWYKKNRERELAKRRIPEHLKKVIIKKTPEERNDYERAYYKEHNVRIRSSVHKRQLGNRLKKYGLTKLDYYSAWICEICHKEMSTPGRGSGAAGHTKCIDHDHDTGKFRGFLCSACNTTLGKMKDSPATLRRAAQYLETQPC